jgi:GT2 family glycosyltransferase
MEPRPTLTIVVVNWNTRELLLACLRSIRPQSLPFSIETIVVDNASTDRSVEAVAVQFPEMVVIRNQTNLGFAKANNQAIEIARGKYILLLNSDTVLCDDALAQMVGLLDEKAEVAAVGAKLLNRDHSLQLSACGFPTVATLAFEALLLDRLFPRSRIFGQYYMTYWDHNDVRAVGYVAGACLMVRATVVADIGPLDEGYFMYAEEMDWCYRMYQRGYRTFYLPTAEVIHYGGQSSKIVRGEMFRHHFRGLLRFFAKNYGKRHAIAARAVIILNLLLRIPILLVSFFLHFNDHERRLRIAPTLRVYQEAFIWIVMGRP